MQAEQREPESNLQVQHSLYEDRYKQTELFGVLDEYPHDFLYSALEDVYERILIPGHRVLNAGCGVDPRFFRRLKGSKVRSANLDLSWHGVLAAKAIAKAATSQFEDIEFCAADVQRIPMSDKSCNSVISLSVIEHLDSPELFIDECARILAPGGTLVIHTPNPDDFLCADWLMRKILSPVWYARQAKAGHRPELFISIPKMTRMLEASGFRIEKIIYTDTLVKWIWTVVVMETVVNAARSLGRPSNPPSAAVSEGNSLAKPTSSWVRAAVRLYNARLFPVVKAVALLDTLLEWRGHSGGYIIVGRNSGSN